MTDRSTLFAIAAERYGTQPEYLWARDPDSAILRHSGNRKWYAVIMRIPRRKLGLDSDERTDVVNLKCDPLMLGSVLTQEGFFPAYHMNKDKWVSVLLDGTVPEETLCALLHMSFTLTQPASGAIRRKPQIKQKGKLP